MKKLFVLFITMLLLSITSCSSDETISGPGHEMFEGWPELIHDAFEKYGQYPYRGSQLDSLGVKADSIISF